MKLDAVQPIAEVEEVAVELPALPGGIAGDDQEPVGLDVNARKLCKGGVGFLERDGKEGVEGLGAKRRKFHAAQRHGCTNGCLRG